MSDIDFDQLKKNLSDLNHTIELAHLRSMIEGLAQLKNHTLNLRESPLYKRTPAEVHDMLEELGWKELEDPEEGFVTNGWQQDTWYTFYSDKWSFRIVLKYSGYYWTMELYRSDIDD